MHGSCEPAPPRRAAFEAVVDEVYQPLQRYLRRRCAPQDAEDLLDDVLLVVWRRLDDVPSDGALPWTYGIARRCLANHRRAGRRRERLLQRVGGAGLHGRAEPDWTSATEAALHRSLDRLPERDREVVRLWAWERLEPREIAVVLGTTPNAVSVRLGRIHRRLADELSRQDPAPAGQERDGSCEEQGR